MSESSRFNRSRDWVRELVSHPSVQGQRWRAVSRAAAWQIYKRLTGRHWDVQVFGSMRMRCYPDSSYALRMLYYGMPEYDAMHFVKRYLRRGDGFLDIGANVGAFSLLAASVVGESGYIDAFEASPRTVAQLSENLALSGLDWVRVHAVALAAEAGTLRFVVSGSDSHSHIHPGAGGGAGTIEVPCVRLDSLISGRPYALAKMDVEGAEPLVMEGAERLLQRANPPVWLMEVNGLLHRYGYTEQQFGEWLAGRDYDLAVYHADRNQLVFDPAPWAVPDSEGERNVLAIHRRARAEVQARLGAELVDADGSTASASSH